MNSENLEGYVEQLLDGYQGEPIVLVGETHMEDSHIRAEESLIQMLEPEYVAHELYGQKNPDELDEHLERGRYLSFENIRNYFDENFEESQVFKDYEGLLDEIAEYEDLTTDQVEEANLFRFMGTWSAGYPEIVSNIQGQIAAEKNEYKKWHAEDEEVDYSRDMKINELHKTLTTIEDLRDSLEAFDEGYRETPIIRSIYELNQDGSRVKMKGADVPSGEKGSTSDRVRERVMAERIEEASEKAENNPVVGIVGANHLKGVEENIEGGKIRTIINKLRDSNDVFTVNLSNQLGSEDDLLRSFKHSVKNKGGLSEEEKEKEIQLEE